MPPASFEPQAAFVFCLLAIEALTRVCSRSLARSPPSSIRLLSHTGAPWLARVSLRGSRRIRKLEHKMAHVRMRCERHLADGHRVVSARPHKNPIVPRHISLIQKCRADSLRISLGLRGFSLQYRSRSLRTNGTERKTPRSYLAPRLPGPSASWRVSEQTELPAAIG